MRKLRVAALILVALVMVLTSCSQDAAAGLGKAMKWMGGNVYGIKPDLRRPDAAIKTVESISADKESLLNTQLATELIDSVIGFSGSTQSVDSFISDLDAKVSTPVSVFRETVDDLRDTVITVASSNNNRAGRIADIFSEVVKSLEGFCDEVGGATELTRRDIVTFSLMNSLICEISESVENNKFESDEVNLAADANKVLSVLKVSTNFSNLNVFGDIDVPGLLSAFSGEKSVERATATNALVSIFGKTLGKLASFTTENNGFSLVKYHRLHMESKSIRFCYEMAMLPRIKSSGNGPNIFSVIDSDVKYGMTLDDFVMYLASSFSRVMDSSEISSAWTAFLGSYLNENNINALCDMKNKAQTLQNPVDVIQDNVLYDKAAEAFGIEDGDAEARRTAAKDRIEKIYDFTKRAGSDENASLWDLVRALNGKTEEEMSDEEAHDHVTNLIVDAIVDSVDEFNDIRDNAVYFTGTCLAILVDIGFDTLFRSLLGLS